VERVLKKPYQFKPDEYEMVCPYRGINICDASISSMFIDKRTKKDYCDNDNYDTCPIFLSKILRKDEYIY